MSAGPCAGCGEPIDGDVFGEWLQTPLGITFARTHRVRACVERSRVLLEGRHIEEPRTREERARADQA